MHPFSQPLFITTFQVVHRSTLNAGNPTDQFTLGSDLHLDDPLQPFFKTARVNQQPAMHQLAVLSIGWVAFFHLTSDEVHHSPFLFPVDCCIFIYFCLDSWSFFLGPDLTHSYPTHLPILVSTLQT